MNQPPDVHELETRATRIHELCWSGEENKQALDTIRVSVEAGSHLAVVPRATREPFARPREFLQLCPSIQGSCSDHQSALLNHRHGLR
jgi:hypothetical protein